MANELIAGMGKMVVSKTPDVLMCLSLGSCVGCVLYDQVKKIGGVAHIMLPIFEGTQNTDNPNKFANIAVPNIYNEMIDRGAIKINIVAKVVGGAHMFPTIVHEDNLDIGKRNVIAVTEQLDKLGIKIVAKEVGGNIGRTIRFFTETGKLLINTKEYSKEI